MIMDGRRPEELIQPFMQGLKFTELAHDFPIAYHCPCTKNRVMNAMTILGLHDLDEMIEEGKTTEVTCQMCGKKYGVTIDELREIRRELHKNSLH
jgi:molecular chaperone Hsp33